MITKITMDKTYSYKEPAYLKTDRKINLCYSLNGSGKTAISNYLSNLNSDEFAQCSIDGFDSAEQKILVYNQEFVKENFYEQDVQKGIFTLAKDNKEASESINKAKENKDKLENKLNDPDDGLTRKLNDKEKEIKDILEKAQEKTWKISTDDKKKGDNFFDKRGFFKSLNSKEKLFKRLIKLPNKDTNRTVDNIKKELQESGEGATEREPLDLLDTDPLLKIEQNNLLKEIIVGNKNSSIANLIYRLGNSDWVKKGIEYFPKDNDQIYPLCQKPTLTPDLQKEIKDYFDETYEKKINELENLRNNYKPEILEKDYVKEFFQEKDKQEIRRLIN